MTTGNSTGERPTQESTDVDRLAWLTLASVQGIGARRIAQLVSHFGSANAVLRASESDLSQLDGLNNRVARAVRRAAPEAVLATIQLATELGQTVLVPSDASYPASLRTIPDPPPVLYSRGDISLTTRRCVAVVGSRNHTPYGATVASELAVELARAGICVVSGMARGLDAVAQASALDAGGPTIGVLGTGVDQVYPEANRLLFKRTLEHGMLLSESPPGERGLPGAFPRRNRLISGLSVALVVVEAAEDSGTLITVNCALEQGREVLAVPGPITSITSRGTNRLIRDGATPILQPEDLLRALGVQRAISIPEPSPFPVNLSADETRVYSVLDPEARHVDEIALASGLPISTLLATLLGLEIGGLAVQLPGGMFRRRVT